eukprot:TRINITY_DN77187_c0_g1_i1.p1 TRINITY_DN77187_c0_g1~~TRINITY_DN77187_c0_g1_i1.p1  ORF type:complete len:454 (+),score=37.95 TRINITY_DN77187_c0_g1_i1:86-1447(+)
MKIRCSILSLVVTTAISLTTSTISWFVTNSAGEQAILALGAGHQESSIDGVVDVLNARLDMIEMYHRHFHEWRQIEGFSVRRGRDLDKMQRFMAGWLLHYSKDAACCSGLFANMYSSGYNDSDPDRYISPHANHIAVLFARPNRTQPLQLKLMGTNQEDGGVRTNGTMKQINVGQQWDHNAWTRDFWEWPLATPGRWFNRADGLTEPCEGKEEGSLTMTRAFAVDESQGYMSVGLEMRACSPIYEASSATGQRELAGTFLSGFFLGWIQQQLASLTLVKQRKSFVMIVERTTGHLVATSDTSMKLWKTVPSASGVTIASPVPASDASDRTGKLTQAILSSAPDGWRSVGNMAISSNDFVPDWVRVSGYQRDGIDWVIVISTPPAQFLDGVLKRRGGVVAIALGVTLAGIIVSGFCRIAVRVLADSGTETQVEPESVVPQPGALRKISGEFHLV